MVSPRGFVNADQYVAVRTGPDVLNRPENELLELTSLKKSRGSVLGRIPAEDKLILTTMLPMGRYILLQDDIELFPRLIVHLAGDMLFLGRSDKYLIKKIDLGGRERLAFSITGRIRKPLPADYASDRADVTPVAGDQKMPEEAKVRFVAEFPQRQTHYTKIITDETGLIYVFIPDILDPGRQEIDIFSPNGRYLYHAIIESPDGLEQIWPVAFGQEHLYALVQNDEGTVSLIKYAIRKPAHSNQ
jgi:hypothetical protein